jgi:hypothetical protein
MEKNIPKFYLISFFLYLFTISAFSQEWTEPVNISPNLPGLDNQPDLCIDKNGVLHCVFTHKLGNNWRKIYYSKSSDDGATWTTPEDISLTPDTSLMNPHIVADTNGVLFVSYDYNTGNPAMTMIYLKTYDGNQWSEPFAVSDGLIDCDHNLLVVDNNNRIYIFWIHGTQLPYYRYFENNFWSDFVSPYPGTHHWSITDISVDLLNNLHCIGFYREEFQTPDDDRVIYFKYEYDNIWSEKTFLTTPTLWLFGNEIDVDNQNNPHVAYRRKQPNTGPDDDSTMYRYYDGNSWSLPELVISDPAHQRIVIDPYNRVHIIDREKIETGTKLVHYQKNDSYWIGYIIDSSENLTSNPDISIANGQIYLVYDKSDVPEITDIYFLSYDIITIVEDKNIFLNTVVR